MFTADLNPELESLVFLMEFFFIMSFLEYTWVFATGKLRKTKPTLGHYLTLTSLLMYFVLIIAGILWYSNVQIATEKTCDAPVAYSIEGVKSEIYKGLLHEPTPAFLVTYRGFQGGLHQVIHPTNDNTVHIVSELKEEKYTIENCYDVNVYNFGVFRKNPEKDIKVKVNHYLKTNLYITENTYLNK